MSPLAHRWLAAALLASACAPSPPAEPTQTGRAALAGAPALLVPFDFALVGTTTPTLVATVTGTTGPADVTFEWSANPAFVPSTTSVVTGIGSGANASLTLSGAQALTVGATLHWRARTDDGSGPGPWSSSRSFTVGPPATGAAWHATTDAQLRGGTLAQVTTSSGAAIIGFSATPIFFDDFESGSLAAWTVTGRAPPTYDVTNAVSAGAPSGTHVMKVVDLNTASSGATAMHDWGTALGRGAIDLWARVDAEGPRFSGGFLRGGTTAFAASLIWGGPPLALRYVNERSFVTELTPPVLVMPNTWHHLRIEYLDRATYDLDLDGQRVGTALLLQQNNGDLTRVAAGSSSTFASVINDYELDDVGVYPGTLSGTWTSPPISAADLGGGYGALSWSTPSARLRLQVEVLTATSWGLATDAELPGNAAGFTTSPVSLAALPVATHPALRVRAVLSRLAVIDASPRLDDVTVSGQSSTFTVAPVIASVPPGGTLTLLASGGTAPYTFFMASAPSGGTVSSTGVYVAGRSCDVTDVVSVLDATSAAAGSVISVTGCVVVSPGAAAVSPGSPVSFSATGGSGAGFTWSLFTNASGGSIGASTGQYLAGTGVGTDAVSVSDSLGNVGAATVTISATDAGGIDAGDVDAGGVDAGGVDAGSGDAGSEDAGAQPLRRLGVGCGCSSLDGPFLLLAVLAALKRAGSLSRCPRL